MVKVNRMLALPATLSLLCPPTAGAIDEQEQRDRIIFQTREMEATLENEGALHGDAALDAYLQAVVDRLFPEQVGRLQVRAYRDEEFNAFAVATGSLYVNIGALLRMHDESELAAVLGHEGSHVTGDHVYRSVRNAKGMMVLGQVLNAGLAAGIGMDPGLGAIMAYSSMAGFSRAFEREADETGYRRMAQAGYAPQSGAEVFDRMARELVARNIKQAPYFFASHPRLRERTENFREFARDAAGGETRRDEFLQATGAARELALRRIYERRDGRTLVFLLADAGLADEMPPHGWFYLGEGYRLRAEAGDEELAVEQYRRSIAWFPDYAPAWGALGRHYVRKGEQALALEHLERFLALAPDAPEAPFARQSVEGLKAGNSR